MKMGFFVLLVIFDESVENGLCAVGVQVRVNNASHTSHVLRYGVCKEALMKIHVFMYVTPCRLVNSDAF
jgi:hypothetical protein